jgi:aryl-alcohol dehydrogenase-like predicted oxidoreductase
VIFGAAALGAMSQERADATIEQVRNAGCNHFDTAASYGESELRLAPWLATHRDEVFLATKTGERTGEAARAELEKSLDRLGVHQVDLIQLHNLVENEEWEQVHRKGGALEALVQARDEGLVRFIGVTGHGTRIAGMHRRSLAEFDYASVLLPAAFQLVRTSRRRWCDKQSRALGACARATVRQQYERRSQASRHLRGSLIYIAATIGRRSRR